MTFFGESLIFLGDYSCSDLTSSISSNSRKSFAKSSTLDKLSDHSPFSFSSFSIYSCYSIVISASCLPASNSLKLKYSCHLGSLKSLAVSLGSALKKASSPEVLKSISSLPNFFLVFSFFGGSVFVYNSLLN